MTDVWADALHVASYGGVEFDCLTARDSLRRSVPRNLIPGRDGGRLQDLGAEPRETHCRIIFWERPPTEGESDISALDHLKRLELFIAAVQRGEPLEFVHPITGSYRARTDGVDFSADADDRNTVLVDVTFVEDGYEPGAIEAGSGMPVASGVAAVEVEVEALNDQLDELAIESSLGDDTLATVSGWGDGDATIRGVNLELQSLSSKLSDAVDAWELATSLERHYLWRSVQRLHRAVRRTAEAFRQTQPTLVATTVAVAVPLRVLMADLYGAALAQERYDQAVTLNDIDDPGLIPAGVVLQLPAPSSRGQQSLRGAA